MGLGFMVQVHGASAACGLMLRRWPRRRPLSSGAVPTMLGSEVVVRLQSPKKLVKRELSIKR
jgi:hypothetical protein